MAPFFRKRASRTRSRKKRQNRKGSEWLRWSLFSVLAMVRAFSLMATLSLCSSTSLVGQPDLSLDSVLSRIEKTGEAIQSMSARIGQKKWTDVLEEFDQEESGRFYFLREQGEVYIRRDITKPQEHSLVIRRGILLFYQPRIKQVLRYHLGKNRDKAEFLLVGFGTDKAALKETYAVRLLGQESIEEDHTYVLELTPKSEQVSAFFSKILLWIDTDLWVPVQQKLVEPTRDYLLIRFTDIQLNDKIPHSRFEFILPGDVKVVGR